jgi:hypothetical protein
MELDDRVEVLNNRLMVRCATSAALSAAVLGGLAQDAVARLERPLLAKLLCSRYFMLGLPCQPA